MNKRAIFIGPLIFFVLSLIIGAIYLQKTFKDTQLQNLESEVKEEKLVEYSNQLFNVKFTYPESWTLTEKQPETLSNSSVGEKDYLDIIVEKEGYDFKLSFLPSGPERCIFKDFDFDLAYEMYGPSIRKIDSEFYEVKNESKVMRLYSSDYGPESFICVAENKGDYYQNFLDYLPGYGSVNYSESAGREDLKSQLEKIILSVESIEK